MTLRSTDVVSHKEKSLARIRSDGVDRQNISTKLKSCIAPLNPRDHSKEIVNINTGKLSNDAVNVDEALRISREQVHIFRSKLPEGFYDKLSKKVVIYAATNCNQTIKVISDDTDIFVLVNYYYWKLGLQSTVVMEATSKEKKLIDIGKTVSKHSELVPHLVAAHAISGCDSVAQFYGIGKGTILKYIKSNTLVKLGDKHSTLKDIYAEATRFISMCYNHPSDDMSQTRIKSWYMKTAKACKSAPQLPSLPPTREAFQENVKRAHLQAMHWYSCQDPEPPKVDPTLFGWTKDTTNQILVPVGIPSGIPTAPPQILKLIVCNCASSQACSSRRCTCSSASLACTALCHCQGSDASCFNRYTATSRTNNIESSDEEHDENEEFPG